jgi:uncharacterized heparinase superfamily protein
LTLSRLVFRALRKPPGVVARRFLHELSTQTERLAGPWRARRFHRRQLLRACSASDLDSLWHRLAERPYPARTQALDVTTYRRLCPGDEQRVLAAAEDALAHRVKLLGPDIVQLGPRIDWLSDYRTGVSWPRRYMRDIVYVNPDDESDVKVPWELSRLQWLIPAGQAYLLTRDERYAQAVRELLDDWIAANPCAQTVNWSSTIEAALRILSWTWFFKAFHDSSAWRDDGFRERFLCALYLHGDFTDRHLELSDVNGNHCTADASGLAFAGLFFGAGEGPKRWLSRAWSLLRAELPRQVYEDGVDFEASVPYHRLVAELFLLPALYREALGLDVPREYRERVTAMARFTTAYCRSDGSVPLWGDGDDARALPLGGQGLNDHRYLTGLVGAAWDVPDLKQAFSGDPSEVLWVLGPGAVESLPRSDGPPDPLPARAFPDGGFFVMRNAVDHVFVDCGRIGLADRGGHGHNDCLSFEAVLDGVHLVTDCGAFVYTRSFAERNRFRSTASHNTPLVDGQEINRFRPELLWDLENDARPELRRFESGQESDVFCGAHAGYRRLAEPVTPVRTIELDHGSHVLRVRDEFEGSGRHRLEIPLHLAPGVSARLQAPGLVELAAGGRSFRLVWQPTEAWSLSIGESRVSPSYGVAVPCVRLVWTRDGALDPALSVRIAPQETPRLPYHGGVSRRPGTFSR